MPRLYAVFAVRLFKRFRYRNGARNGRADHRVITHTDKTHHFYVRGNGRRTCELRVAVHSSHSIGHAVRRRTCRHIVGVKSSSRAAARRNGEIFLAVFNAPFFVGTRNGVLESGGIRRVTRDGYAYVFEFHYRYAFGYIIRAVTFYVRSRALGIRYFFYDFYFFRVRIEFRFYVSEAVDSRNDERSVFS